MNFDALSKILGGYNCDVSFTLSDGHPPCADENGIYLPKSWKSMKIHRDFEDEVFVNVFHEFQHIKHSRGAFLNGDHRRRFRNGQYAGAEPEGKPYPGEYFHDCCNVILDCRDDALGFKAYKGAPTVYARDERKMCEKLLARQDRLNMTPQAKTHVVLLLTLLNYKVRTRKEYAELGKVFDAFPELSVIAQDEAMFQKIDAFCKLTKAQVKDSIKAGGNPLVDVGIELADYIWKTLKREHEKEPEQPPVGGEVCENETPQRGKNKAEDKPKVEAPIQTPDKP